MKNKNLKKISLAIALGLTSTLSNAAWLVSNINDVRNQMYFSGIISAIETLRGSVEVSAASTERLQLDNDQRLRMALGQADIAKKDVERMPTVKECIDISKKVKGAEAFGGSIAGSIGAQRNNSIGGGGGGKPPPASQTPNERAAKIDKPLAAPTEVLNSKADVKTCSKDMPDGYKCDGGSDGKYAGADVYITGIKANMDTNGRDAKMDFKNYTLDEDGFKAAQKYISDATLFDGPKKIKQESLKLNPVYSALYQTMYSKLMAAHEVMGDIANMRRASLKEFDNSNPAGKYWNETAKNNYKDLFNNKIVFPGSKPSLFELVNYNVYNDYLGIPENEQVDEEFFRKNMIEKTALSNFIAWQQYKQQENTNILLSQMLVQMLTPIKKETIDFEYNKTTNIKQN